MIRSDYGLSSKITKRDKRQKIWAKQREERGFDDTETWNLDYVFIEFILPRLKRFREVHSGYPAHLTEDKWKKILDKMILAFETLKREEETGFLSFNEKEQKAVQSGLNLFAKYFTGLWW